MPVLIAGGSTNNRIWRAAVFYDPTTGLWTATTATRALHGGLASANLLADGTVLLDGGLDRDSIPVAAAELYRPSR